MSTSCLTELHFIQHRYTIKCVCKPEIHLNLYLSYLQYGMTDLSTFYLISHSYYTELGGDGCYLTFSLARDRCLRVSFNIYEHETF